MGVGKGMKFYGVKSESMNESEFLVKIITRLDFRLNEGSGEDGDKDWDSIGFPCQSSSYRCPFAFP